MMHFPTTLSELLDVEGTVRAGGTDLTERRRLGHVSGPLIDLRDLAGYDRLTFHDGRMWLGTKARIADLAAHPVVRASYRGLAEAAGGLATPEIRAVATLGGNLLQEVRCAYFRHPHLVCAKRGGSGCPARSGDHLFGVCFDEGPCVAPHPSTLAVALLAYGAEVVIDDAEPRSIAALYGDGSDPVRTHRLEPGRALTWVTLAPPAEGEQAGWSRTSARARAEWPLVEAVVRIVVSDGRIRQAHVALGGVATRPLRVRSVEDALVGGPPTPEHLSAAADRAAEGARPLPETAYKLQLLAPTILDALENALGAPGASVPKTEAD